MAPSRLKSTVVAPPRRALLVLGWLVAAAAAARAAPPGSGASGSVAAGRDPAALAAESLFVRVVEQALDPAVPLAVDVEDEESLTQVDLVAKQLDEQTSHSAEMRRAMAQVVDASNMLAEKDALLDDVLASPSVGTPAPEPTATPAPTPTPLPSTKKRPASYSRFGPARRKLGLLDAVLPSRTEEERNPYILHAQHQVDFDKVLAQTMGQIKQMSPYESKCWSDAVNQLIALEDATEGESRLGEGLGEGLDGLEEAIDLSSGVQMSESGPLWPLRAVVRLTASVMRAGVKFLDITYQTPEFITAMPLLGAHIGELKRRTEPIYHMVNIMRSSAHLLKLVGHKMGGGAGEKQTELEGKRTNEAKRLVSKAGAVALKSVAYKVMRDLGHKSLKEEDAQEFVTRTFYAILSSIVPSSSTS